VGPQPPIWFHDKISHMVSNEFNEFWIRDEKETSHATFARGKGVDMNKSLKLSNETTMFILTSAGYTNYSHCIRFDEKIPKNEHYGYHTRTVMWIEKSNYIGMLSKVECPLPLPKAKEWV
jgi:hypothetical protein